ncbi:DUF1194 domain-containing protein [Haloferula sargassicola]|uniref:DUF1194 domain-containing protein n=1 Tax=Haloferula sargassicola TaxID=490096 RepID=UPI0033658DC6
MFGLPSRSQAESVDSELLLLVDVSKDGLKKNDFDTLMSGYASAFTSSSVIDAIASGAAGRIAISLMFFGGSPSQSLGIPWMSISNEAEAQMFAGQLTSLARPSNGNYTFADAMGAGIPSFGTETGAAGNGFESPVQMVQVGAVSRPNGSTKADEAASQQALASGIDLISAVVLGKKADAIESYYRDSIVGGTVGLISGSVVSTDLSSRFTLTMEEQLSGHLGAAAAVPESSAVLLFASSLGVLLMLRRRTSH